MLHCFEELPAHSVHPGVGGGEEAFHEAKVPSVRGHCQHCEGVALTLGKWESCLCSEEDINYQLTVPKSELSSEISREHASLQSIVH